jgi:hypothetical protein
MGVPTTEVSSTSAAAGSGDHEVHKGHVVALGEKNVLMFRGLSDEGNICSSRKSCIKKKHENENCLINGIVYFKLFNPT